jgi:hypothetical protein
LKEQENKTFSTPIRLLFYDTIIFVKAMPRASSSKKKKNIGSEGFLTLLFMVVTITLLLWMDFYFQSAEMSASRAASKTNVSTSERSNDFLNAQRAAFLIPSGTLEKEIIIPSFDESNTDPQCVFYPSQRNVLYGQSVRLIWECINSDKCDMEGVGAVNPSNKEGFEMFPENSGTYALNCRKGNIRKSFNTDISVYEFTIREISSFEASEE